MNARKSKERERLAIPGDGRALSTETERRAKPFREAAYQLAAVFNRPEPEAAFTSIFGARAAVATNLAVQTEPLARRAAWSLLTVYALARLVGKLPRHSQLIEAELWFVRSHSSCLPSLVGLVPKSVLNEVEQLLDEVSYDCDFHELLPYILEPNGHASRLTVMQDEGTRKVRQARRDRGIFYTPMDVAEFIVERIKPPTEPLTRRWFDPSCGSGIFLLAAFRKQREDCEYSSADSLRFAVSCLYGADISAVAVESTCFVLLCELLFMSSFDDAIPWNIWQALRLNFAVEDSLCLEAHTTTPPRLVRTLACERDRVRTSLLNGLFLDSRVVNSDEFTHLFTQRVLWEEPSAHRVQLDSYFPEVAGGFDVVVGNPPYAKIGNRSDGELLAKTFDSFGKRSPSPADNTYPLFIEMMWKFSRKGLSTSAIVVPLSIAYHKGHQFRNCRRAMQAHGGRWQVASFDREPHALFGEDVKTRNAVLFRFESPDEPSRTSRAVFETTRMHKWTSRTRQLLFPSIEFTPIDCYDVGPGIPKLDGTYQADVLHAVKQLPYPLSENWFRVSKCLPIQATLPSEHPRAFVSSTAYNFLNLFRCHNGLSRHEISSLSQNKIFCLEFESEDDARITFAILSSQLTYWMWHVYCDGFHVPAWFLSSLPFGRRSFTNDQKCRIARLGGKLWDQVQENRVSSLNAGRLTIAYRPLACSATRTQIDGLLLDSAGVKRRNFVEELNSFVRSTVVIDENDHQRDKIKNHFSLVEAKR